MSSRGTTNATGPTSKKPSDASLRSTRKPPDPLILFLDEGIGRHVVADALRAVGAPVEVFLDHFPPGTPDETWLAEAGRCGWLVLTKDYGIRYRGLARQAIERSLAQVFVLKRSEDLTGPEMAGIFVKALFAIYRTSRRHLFPFIAKVWKDGRIDVWWPERPKKPRRR